MEDSYCAAIHNGLLPHIQADLIKYQPDCLETLIRVAELAERAHTINPTSTSFTTESLESLFKKVMNVSSKAEVQEKVTAEKDINSVQTTETVRPQNQGQNRANQNFRYNRHRNVRPNYDNRQNSQNRPRTQAYRGCGVSGIN